MLVYMILVDSVLHPLIKDIKYAVLCLIFFAALKKKLLSHLSHTFVWFIFISEISMKVMKYCTFLNQGHRKSRWSQFSCIVCCKKTQHIIDNSTFYLQPSIQQLSVTLWIILSSQPLPFFSFHCWSFMAIWPSRCIGFLLSNPSSCSIQGVCSFSVPTYYLFIFPLQWWFWDSVHKHASLIKFIDIAKL